MTIQGSTVRAKLSRPVVLHLHSYVSAWRERYAHISLFCAIPWMVTRRVVGNLSRLHNRGGRQEFLGIGIPGIPPGIPGIPYEGGNPINLQEFLGIPQASCKQ